MAKLRKLSLVDIILIIVLVIGAVITFLTAQMKANTEEEKVRLELRRQAAEINLSEADRAASIESLQQRLQQLRSTPVETTLPSKAKAVGTTNQILQYALSNVVTIIRWDTSYTSITLAEKEYPAIEHSLMIEGEADGLIGLIEALTKISAVTAIQNIDISAVAAGTDVWQITFELLIYYS